MNYNLLESIIPNGFDLTILFIILFVLCIVLLIFVIVLLSKFRKLEKKYEKFMTGRTAKSLEKEIMELFEDNVEIKNNIEENQLDIKTLYGKLTKAFQKIGLVKYDAFNQMGGNLSYSLVLLDEKDNGFILNSVHGNEGCYSYSKEVKHGKCDIDLSSEEREALEMAMN